MTVLSQWLWTACAISCRFLPGQWQPSLERAQQPVNVANQWRSLLAFAAVTSLFFAWGFITSNNDPLIVALRAAFALDYSQALLTQIVFFLAYGLLSLPAAWLGSRLGPVDMILGSLLLMACGCVAVVFSTDFDSFWLVLAALFVLAAGFTALQVAANPLAADLGPPKVVTSGSTLPNPSIRSELCWAFISARS